MNDQPQPELTSDHVGDPGVVDQMQLRDFRIVGLTPAEDPYVQEPTVTLVMVGVSALTGMLRHVAAGVSPQLAVQIGDGMAATGRELAEQAPASASGLVVARGMGDAHAVARQAAAVDGLRERQ